MEKGSPQQASELYLMTRVETLNAYLEQVRRHRFRPGSHDCGMYVAGWVQSATGVDHGKIWRGRYRSMAALDELMKEAGFATHVDYVASLFAEIPPAVAQVGDLAVVEGRALGIIAADRVFVLRPDGLGHVSRLRAERAFRI
ncbi:DUF6950 family protein [Pseudosulfitobacter pseudonitzschiae]|nr:hypothetical protein [Pseudosulfitobacter pseudonitzschiae]MCI2213288.1 hypothetical protein [Pseudosulfitobacter pseudonitzschiae]QRD48272.1 hypothetical protein JNX04_09680 [Pseudosulfitobacter pseudonitzschiae]QSH67724.2 hypothetical protein JQK83_015200 [Pseudosulfitobacter pseudonitzschiae]UFE46049.1 hypothetical protein LOE37_13010 [Pseudosulfitobacter pseudonitzschiae]UFE60649.1 hypothetical protein LOE28_15345 [Pseudosulfitobacter pseudonitzschiae]